MSYLELLPAVDVKDGRAVRLVQGELDRESVYGAPLEVALEFQAKCYKIPALVPEVLESDETYTDIPGAVWQSGRFELTDENVDDEDISDEELDFDE